MIKKRLKFGKLYLLFLIILHFFIFLGLYYEGRLPVSQDNSLPPKIVELKKGENLFSIAQTLYEQGLIKNRLVFILEAIRTGAYREFKAGEYALYPYQSLNEILHILRAGKVYLHRITVFEGATLWQIAELLEKNEVCPREEFLTLAKDRNFLQSLGIPSETAEGFLFPDTYFFPKNTPCSLVMAWMVKNFFQKWETLKKRAEATKLSLKEIVTLASIVEKEAYLDEEKPIIAGVYLNRLKKGMPLQADPTINYALKNFRRLTYQDYRRVKSPYNTYLHNSLPPTPIGNPGLSSLKAVLYPAKVPYLYFVADGTGKHIFSTTYKDHLKAIGQIREMTKKEEVMSKGDLVLKGDASVKAPTL